MFSGSFGVRSIVLCVKRRSLLPGVTTLSRDLERRPILGASNHYYLVFLLCGIFHCWSEETQENILKALFIKQVQINHISTTKYYLGGKSNKSNDNRRNNSQIQTNTVMYTSPSLSGILIFT